MKNIEPDSITKKLKRGLDPATPKETAVIITLGILAILGVIFFI